MKLTQQKLRKIIRKEIEETLNNKTFVSLNGKEFTYCLKFSETFSNPSFDTQDIKKIHFSLIAINQN